VAATPKIPKKESADRLGSHTVGIMRAAAMAKKYGGERLRAVPKRLNMLSCR